MLGEEHREDLLDTWKEIANYLNRDVRTVQRMEPEGLPVYRHPTKKRANVYAYRSEIDLWWSQTQGKLTDKANGNEASAAVAAEAPPIPLGGGRLWLTVLAVAAVFLAAGAVFWASRRSAVKGGDGIRQELLATLRMGYGVVSPDGKRLIYADSETAHLQVRNLESGEGRVVVPEWTVGRYVWSPDSRKVAYIAFQRPRRLEVVDVDTGERQVLQNESDHRYLFRPHAWARDGKRILGRIVVPNEDVQVAFLNVTDGGLEPVAAPVKDAQMLYLSPDGRFIAYRSRRDGNTDTYLWPLDGKGEETRITEFPDTESGAIWSPDRRYLLFTRRQHTNQLSLWAVEMSADGRKAGQPFEVKSLGYSNVMFWKSVSANGDFFFALREGSGGEPTCSPWIQRLGCLLENRNRLSRAVTKGGRRTVRNCTT